MQIGPFSDLQVVARGGMGVVARGVDPRTGRRVAVKTLDVGSKLLARALVREAEVLASLQHPGVAPLVDHGVSEGIPWFAMAWVDGVPLQACLGAATGDATATLPFFTDDVTPTVAPRPAPQDPKSVLLLLARLARTLAWLHGEGIVHRDLKPDNVIVRDGWPVLVDFGIGVRFAAAGREMAQLPPLRAGTPAFMAPEQRLGHAVDARADLYALGRLLEMGVGSACPPELVPLRDAMLSDAVEERPGSAEDLADAIDAWTGTRSHWPDAPPPRPFLYRAPFAGRARDVEQVSARLRTTGAVVIRGAPGVGRTRLAVAVSRAFERAGTQVLDRFPTDGVDAFLIAVDAALQQGETLLLVDDLHLNEVLRRAVARLAAAIRPGLTVLATWSDAAGPVPTGLSDAEYALEPLAPHAVKTLVDGMLGGSAETVPAWLSDRVDGNPLRAAEWLRTAVALKVLERRGHWRPIAHPATLGLGTSLAALGEARLESVHRDTRQALEALAVSSVLADEASLHEAVAVGLLERRDADLHFVHEPLRRAVVEATPPGRTRALCRTAARRLEADPRDAGAIADLWIGAGEDRAALPWLWRAAEEASISGAFASAIARLERWLEVGGEPVEQRVRARIQLVEWLLEQGRVDEALPHARAAVERAEGRDPVLLAQAQRAWFDVQATRDGGAAVVPAIRAALAAASMPAARIELLVALSDRLCDLGREQELSPLLDAFQPDTPAQRGIVLDLQGMVAYHASRFNDAVQAWTRALEWADDPSVRDRYRSRLATSLAQDGQPERALEALDEQMDHAAESGSLNRLAMLHMNRGLLKVLLPDLQGAWADTQRAHRLALTVADSLLVQLVTINLVFIAIEQGELDVAQDVAQGLRPTPSARIESARRLVLATLARAVHAFEESEALLADPPHDALRTRFLIEQGRLRLARGESARDPLERARNAAAEQGIAPGHRSFEGQELARLIDAQRAWEDDPSRP
jgi:tetratricopeptide (TPR) repeat protein